MTTIELGNGITLTATARTIHALNRLPRVWRTRDAWAREKARRAECAERAQWVAWLSDPANWENELYSDIHKDIYGFRP